MTPAHDRQQMRQDAVGAAIFVGMIVLAIAAFVALLAWGLTNVAPSGQAPAPSLESVSWLPSSPEQLHWAVTGEPPIAPSAKPVPVRCAGSSCATGPRMANNKDWCWCQ